MEIPISEAAIVAPQRRTAKASEQYGSTFQHVPDQLAKVGLDDIELSLRHRRSCSPIVNNFRVARWLARKGVRNNARIVISDDLYCYSRTALPTHSYGYPSSFARPLDGAAVDGA